MKHFKRSEFACKCGKCESIAVDYELVEVLDDLREHFGRPVVVTSGYRCIEHNRAIGGAESSKHMLGIASDIRCVGVTPNAIYNYLDGKYPNKYGLGKYNAWVHVDVRQDKARW